MLDKILDEPLNGWLSESTEANHIVLSSRIRLARNFKDIQFTNRNEAKDLEKVNQMMRNVLADLVKADTHQYSNISFEQLSDVDKEVLVEKHLISPNLADKSTNRSLIVSDDASIAIMVNEEDHIRIQAMEAGLQLKKAYNHAVLVDDAIESKYNYAFSEQFGYLTACPTNVGTGLRASVMIHLPALTLTGRLNRIIRSIVQLGYTVRGLYGEGSDVLGNIYQISNQRTMGISEEETIEQLTKVVEGLVAEEIKCRDQIKAGDFEAFEDKIWRSYGILQYARRLSGKEALSLLSDMQLGMDMGVLPAAPKNTFNKLIVISRPYFLSKYAGKADMSPAERDSYRAKVVRDILCK